MIITLKNATRQARVYQLDQRVASAGYKSHSETVIRVDHDVNGNSQVRRKRLRHGPVLRMRAGEEVSVPAALLHDKNLRKDTTGNRPPVRIVRRETQEEYKQRLASEKKTRQDLEDRRAARAAEQSASTPEPKRTRRPRVKSPRRKTSQEMAGSADTNTSGTES